ncbi:hypothetical protein JAAARDRAFT_40784 [Jaapia argillacea MUCL 33604]|uniref:Uncharacterized protein n=1 Tax=Jaapia argillacea MUCL 33604 TaxID=933084 RepID=A0A067PA09_9AGAM|nr:hypothetical protein JAAARDRAFT_40784 [Jaapia argillacea MUCL 33604]
MPESDHASVVSADAFSDISSIDHRHPDEVWDGVANSPRIHSMVVFSINPTATIDSLFGEDVSEALDPDSLPRRTYAGFVQEMHGLPLRDDPYTECRIYFLTQGLPSPSADGVRDSSMCVPLWPTTEHPSGRKPIKLREPLPWDNCYLHSTLYVDVRVLSADFDDAKIKGVMFFPEGARHRELRNEDQARKSALWKERMPATPLVEGKLESARKPDADHTLPDPILFHGEAECKDIEDTTSQQGSREEIGNLLLGIMCAEPTDHVTVDATYDLSEVTSLPDPQEFFEEEKAIRKLARDFMERKAVLEAEEETVWVREMREEQDRMLAANSQPSADTCSEPERKPLPKRKCFNLLEAFTRTREWLRLMFNRLSLSTSRSSASAHPQTEIITPKSKIGRTLHGPSRFRTTVQQKIRSALGLTRPRSKSLPLAVGQQ